MTTYQHRSASMSTAKQTATLLLAEGWRPAEDGELQWIVQRRQGQQWHAKAYCGSKAGLIEVAIPHHRIAAPATVLAALRRLPESYEPRALAKLAAASPSPPLREVA